MERRKWRKNGYETEDYAFLLFYVPSKVLETGEVIFDTLLARREVDIKSVHKRVVCGVMEND